MIAIRMNLSLKKLGFKHNVSKGANDGIDIIKFKTYLDNVIDKTNGRSYFKLFPERGGFEGPIINKAYEIKMNNNFR